VVFSGEKGKVNAQNEPNCSPAKEGGRRDCVRSSLASSAKKKKKGKEKGNFRGSLSGKKRELNGSPKGR